MKLPLFDTGLFCFGRTSTKSRDLVQDREKIELSSPTSWSDEAVSESSPLQSLSLEFRDEGSYFTESHASTVTIPDSYPDTPLESRNGTTITEIQSCLRSPGKTSGMLARVSRRQASSLDWELVRNKVGKLAEAVTESISDELNRAMEGQDAIAIYNAGAALIPTFSLPKRRYVEKLMDNFSDTIQERLKRKPSIYSLPSDSKLQISKWEYSGTMVIKAQKELVKQRICHAWQVMPSRDNLVWHIVCVSPLPTFTNVSRTDTRSKNC